jgi:hypothetical protein
VTSQPSAIRSAAARSPTAPAPDAASLQVELAGEPRDGGRRGRVAAVGVEHRGHPERAEERLLDLGEHFLAGAHIRAADPHRERGQVLGAAGEERRLHEAPHRVGLDAAVPEQLVDAGVVGDDRVERARVLVGVELDQDLLHVSSSAARLVRCAVSRTRSRRGSSNVM